MANAKTKHFSCTIIYGRWIKFSVLLHNSISSNGYTSYLVEKLSSNQPSTIKKMVTATYYITMTSFLSHDIQMVEGVLNLWNFLFSNICVPPMTKDETNIIIVEKKQQRTLSLDCTLEYTDATMILNLVPTILKRFNKNDNTSNSGTSDQE